MGAFLARAANAIEGEGVVLDAETAGECDTFEHANGAVGLQLEHAIA